jgi:hypothetical protein
LTVSHDALELTKGNDSQSLWLHGRANTRAPLLVNNYKAASLRRRWGRPRRRNCFPPSDPAIDGHERPNSFFEKSLPFSPIHVAIHRAPRGTAIALGFLTLRPL